jgi:cell wall-associated NlpC family hydrolase
MAQSHFSDFILQSKKNKVSKIVFLLFFAVSSILVFTGELYNKQTMLALTPTVVVKKIKAKKRTKREIIVETAYSLIGIDYWPGGEDSEYGYDCSGFTMYSYLQAGVDIPRRAIEQWRSSKKIEEADLKAGDLLFFNTRGYGINHVGIYIKKGVFIHSPGIGKVICEESLNKPYWRVRFMAAGRYLE